MKTILLCLLLLCVCTAPFARHGKGGYLTYEYMGNGALPGTTKYKITVLHYVNCQEVQFETGVVYVGVFNAANNAFLQTITIKSYTKQAVSKQHFNPCINPAPVVCYNQFTYTATVDLENNAAGFILTEQECCRADNIVNVLNSGQTGATNTNTIPGIINGVSYRNNSSPVPALKDTAVICHNSYFQIDFGSTDPDGDELSYSFCAAEEGGTVQNRQPNPPAPPPYRSVNYPSGFSGNWPLGTGVSINSKTGMISGIAPGTTGQYVIAVCIQEMRNGMKIGTTKKEVLVTVADCHLTAATLQPQYINCDSFGIRFENESYSSNISSYAWDFGVPGITSDESDQPTPMFTYPQAGTYTVKLKVTSPEGCADSTTSVVRIYPGFQPGFEVAGSCFQSPFEFTNTSFAAYGTQNSWTWNFGDGASGNNSATTPNATHLYTVPDTVLVSLTVTTDVGCSGVVSKPVVVSNKPYIRMPFTDTLICNGDHLPLAVESTGDYFRWMPANYISNPNILNPVVQPVDTTTYTLTVKDKSCVGTASLRVNVLDFITVRLPVDTAVCAGDTVVLHPVSDALQYTWTVAGTNATLLDANTKHPKTVPLSNATYHVTARLGHCMDTASTTLLVSPYPTGYAGTDTVICFGSTARLHGSTTAAHYAWSPANSLQQANTLSPVAGPGQTTPYFFTVSDTFYCPKSTTDTVLVQVLPPVQVFAGNDTSAVVNQPLQLSATGNNDIVSYAWSPSSWLSNTSQPDPVATIISSYTDAITYAVKATTALGCTGLDSITVFIYNTLPSLFIPDAFTPNGDGRNDIFKPLLAGIRQLEYFRVFNRRGQLVFQTSQAGKGWDGSINGMQQPAGTYVFSARAVDYLGKVLEKKGTLVLIR